ncbi:hypothetical protein PCANC_05705 [Puccinia coronata f. sp. avenae]|uniref:Retrovirus-related Pol polyprotein from transposon TNT 1-94-like beta-barrel domain-containing protein n=1 Tax=Puccinia coronata f. sp. avenae TaxID=200324 RepID=A0A2N5VXU7_9BASI|nr:hypothetical protein PCANC_05705 [Puccinia coronata f. sp. avenae]
MSDSTSKLPILKDENYHYWKSQILYYCMEKNLDGFLIADKAATAKDNAQKEAWTDKKTSAAGLIGCHLTLSNHFESSSSQNQAKVYQKFLKVGFQSNLRDFLTQVKNSIARMRAVGLVIGTPKSGEPDVKERLLSKHIVSLLPTSFDHTKEIIFTQRPLTLKKICNHLEAKSLDADEPVTIKTESAHSASSRSPSNKCTDGKHNPLSRHRKERCYQLYPHIKAEDEAKKKAKEEEEAKKRAKAVAKVATTTSAAIDSDDDDNASVISHPKAYCAIGQALSVLPDGLALLLLDSGCSDHMFPDCENFSSYKPMKSLVEIANGKTVPIVGSGYVQIKNSLGKTHTFKAVHVPSLSHPLISFGRLFIKNCSLVQLSTDEFSLQDSSSSTTIFTGQVKGKVFSINGSILRTQGQSLLPSSFKATQYNAKEIHRRAGHPSGEALKLMFGVDFNTMTCKSCQLSKSHWLPYSSTPPDAEQVLNFIYMDLSGKITPKLTGVGLLVGQIIIFGKVPAGGSKLQSRLKGYYNNLRVVYWPAPS